MVTPPSFRSPLRLPVDLEHLLGEGADARVWRARWPERSAAPVAVKQLKDAAEPGAAGRLLREYSALLQCLEVALPQPLAFFPALQGRPPALVMELCAGESLDKALPVLGQADWDRLFGEALRALAALHGAGLGHCDLHPGNLLVAPDGALRLMDLGLAHALGTQESTAGPGAVVFAAPQRLAGAPADARDDLFSLGVAFVRSLGAPHPWGSYPSHSPLEGTAPDLSHVPVSEALKRMLASCVAWERDARPPSAARAFEAWIEASATPLVALDPTRVRRLFARQVASHEGPASGDVVGPSGSGRSTRLRGRVLDALGRGELPVVFEALADEPLPSALQRLARAFEETLGPMDGLGPALGRSGQSRAETSTLADRGALRLADAGGVALETLARHVKRSESVVHLFVEDADALPAALREAIDPARREGILPGAQGRLTLTASRLDPRAPGLDAHQVESLLALLAPGRLPNGALTAALTVAARGSYRRLGALLSAWIERGAIVVGRASLDFEPRRVPAVDDALAHLDGEPARLAARLVLARAHRVAGDVRDAEVLLATGLCRMTPEGSPMALEPASPAARTELRALIAPAVLALEALDAAERAPPGEAVRLRSLAAACDPMAPLPDVRDLRALATESASDLAADAGLEATLAWLDAARARGVELSAVAAGAASRLARAGRSEEAERWMASVDAASCPPDALVELSLARSALAFRAGRYPEARAALDTARAAFDGGSGATELRRSVWVSEAFVATWQGDLQGAAASIASARDATPTAEESAALDYVDALGAYYRGALDEAQQGFEAVLSRDAAGPDLVLSARTGLGLVAHRRGDLSGAAEAYRAALAEAEALGDRPRRLNLLMNLGVVAHEQADLGLACDHYTEALRLARALGDRGGQCRTGNNLGNLLRQMGSIEEAERTLEESLAIAVETGNRYVAGINRCVLGEIARVGMRLAASRDTLSAALRDLEEAGAATEAAEVRLELAACALVEGRFDEAERSAHAIESAARDGGNEELATRAILLRAEVALEGRRDPHGAAEMLAKARTALARIDKPQLALRVDALRAECLALAGSSEATELGRNALKSLDALVARLPQNAQAAFLASPPWSSIGARLRLISALPGIAHARPGGRGGSPAGMLDRLLQINKRLNAERDSRRLIELIMDSAVLLTGAERGFLLMEEAEDVTRAKGLRVAVARNLDQENLKNPRLKLSMTLTEEVYASGEPVLTTDAQADSRFAEQRSVHAGRLRSIVCVPLVLQGRPIGVLYVDNRFAEGAFSEGDVQVLEALADQAAIAIANARLFEEVQRKERELERSRSEIAALNERLEEDLRHTAAALDETRQRLDVERRSVAARSEYKNLIGESAPLRACFALMDRVRDHAFPVLVLGESGTGKDLIARAIHFTGTRKDKSFVAINCGGIPATLLESELFGHTRGSFTGAATDKQGLFDVADGGTLFLDEVGDMPAEMQVKLLRVLQTGEVQKIGATKPRTVDVRVIAATHRDLAQLVRDRTFREDLYYRLNVVAIRVPALRERIDDLPVLCEHFLAQFREAGYSRVRGIGSDASRRLRSYGWPGNVRELETVLKNACLFCDGEVLGASDLATLDDRSMRQGARASDTSLIAEFAVLPIGEIERRVILSRLESLGGNKRRAADSLGIDRRTLYNKLATYGIKD